MSDVVIEREFKQALDVVYAFLSTTEHILKWWGPEGIIVKHHDMSFDSVGPWFSEMHGAEGAVYKVSGQVKAVNPPNSLEMTWAWHDDKDNRGHESNVRFELSPSENGGTKFKLIHTNLADDDSAKNHIEGWTSSLNRLEKFVN